MTEGEQTHKEQQSIDFDASRPSQRTEEPYDLYNGIPPHQAGSDTSRDAAEAIEPDVSSLRGKVLSYIRSRGREGATDKEIQAALNMSVSTEVPRRRELVLKGLVADSGWRRKTKTGRPAVVWAKASLHPIDRGPHEPAKQRIARTEDRVVALELELAETKAKLLSAEQRFKEEEESGHWVHGKLANIADLAFDDPGRALNHGYEGVENRIRELVEGAKKTGGDPK